MTTQLTITKTHRIDGIDQAWDVEFLDTRRGGIVALTITRDELAFPDRPTVRGLEIACLARLLPRIELKPARETKCKAEKWTRHHEAARDVARDHSADIDRIVAAIPEAYAQRLAEWEADSDRRAAREAAARMMGIQPRQLGRYIAKLEDSYKDRTAIDRFDEMTEELADAHPAAGIDRSDPDTLWELLRAELGPKPRRLDPATIRRAAELVATPADDSVEFGAWDDSAAAESSAELVPF